jgi:hypothetical protein
MNRIPFIFLVLATLPGCVASDVYQVSSQHPARVHIMKQGGNFWNTIGMGVKAVDGKQCISSAWVGFYRVDPGVRKLIVQGKIFAYGRVYNSPLILLQANLKPDHDYEVFDIRTPTAITYAIRDLGTNAFVSNRRTIQLRASIPLPGGGASNNPIELPPQQNNQ